MITQYYVLCSDRVNNNHNEKMRSKLCMKIHILITYFDSTMSNRILIVFLTKNIKTSNLLVIWYIARLREKSIPFQ